MPHTDAHMPANASAKKSRSQAIATAAISERPRKKAAGRDAA
jgi:hypothetical protein